MSVFAILEEGKWVSAQQSALTVFGAEPERFDEHWPRAGSLREGHAALRIPAYEVLRTEERLWPTPAASLPNDGEEPAQWLRRFVHHAAKGNGATRAGAPLAVAARAPIILSVAKSGAVGEAMALLECHTQVVKPELASTAKLNPRWVELLMGFPAGWTEVDPQSISP